MVEFEIKEYIYWIEYCVDLSFYFFKNDQLLAWWVECRNVGLMIISSLGTCAIETRTNDTVYIGGYFSNLYVLFLMHLVLGFWGPLDKNLVSFVHLTETLVVESRFFSALLCGIGWIFLYNLIVKTSYLETIGVNKLSFLFSLRVCLELEKFGKIGRKQKLKSNFLSIVWFEES